jgi:hypothetical protein
MPHLIFLNERSHPTGDIHPALAIQLLTDLVNVLLQIKKIVPQMALITSEPLSTLSIGQNYSVSLWLNEASVDRERARFLLSLGQQAPFRIAKDLFGDPDPGITVYRHAGQTVEGIGLAHLYGGMPVSFCTGDLWRVPALTLEAQQLLESGEQTFTFELRHAALVDHVKTHREWLRALRRKDIANATDLYSRRSELFSHIDFGLGIKSDLERLQPAAFLQVVEYLGRMDDALDEWNPENQPIPQYPPNTTDESASRKSLCNFPGITGVREQFTWHGRYTPGAGRIHFRLQHAQRRVVVGYIGQKIGA